MFNSSKPKLKWSVDPQNTTWIENKSNFGYKMLQKMGWKKGKGLGLNENGLLEPLKLASIVNKNGIGCKTSYDDTWIAHQDEFASLLMKLNSNSYEKPASSTNNVIDLEKTSESQKRIHYKKFAQGKNLSSYKRSDMMGIFGVGKKRSHSTSMMPKDLMNNDSNHNACIGKNKKRKKKHQSSIDNFSNNKKKSFCFNLKVSKYSMNEYFKQCSKAQKYVSVSDTNNVIGSKLVSNSLKCSSSAGTNDEAEKNHVTTKKTTISKS